MRRIAVPKTTLAASGGHAYAALVPAPPPAVAPTFAAPNVAALLTSYAAATEFEDRSIAENTKRAYASDWNAYAAWCTRVGVPSLPSSPVLLKTYLADQAGTVDAPRLSPATLGRRVAAINAVHTRRGYPKPGTHDEVQRTLAGIRRTHAAPPRRMAPLLLDGLRGALEAVDTRTFPAGAIGVRDQALLLIGFAGGFRRSELAELRGSDVMAHAEDGIHIRVRRSKTDQEGDGQIKGFPYGRSPVTCPPCAVARWRRVVRVADDRAQLMRVLREMPGTHVCRDDTAVGTDDGDDETPFFRRVDKAGVISGHGISGHAINLRIKTRVEAVGMDARHFGGHSLRAGFVTQSFRAGVTAHEIMRQTGHRNPATLEVYSRENDPMRGNAVAKLGL